MATQVRKNILSNKWEVQEKRDGRWVCVSSHKTEVEAKAALEAPQVTKQKKARKSRK